jgi:hypothetical protein
VGRWWGSGFATVRRLYIFFRIRKNVACGSFSVKENHFNLPGTLIGVLLALFEPKEEKKAKVMVIDYFCLFIILAFDRLWNK